MTIRDNIDLRETIIATARRMNASGLTRNTSGNLGVRVEGGLLVTPSGMRYGDLVPGDIVFLDWAGRSTGRRLPSSEWRFHRDILAGRDDIDVVIHAHSPFAASIACLRKPIPAFHYMVAVAGGPDIRCAPYATFGTEDLSRHAVTALEDRRACLLANHGQIALGRDPESAFEMAVEVETLAEMYWRVLQIGEPIILDAGEMAVVLEKFKTYGKQPVLDDRTSASE